MANGRLARADLTILGGNSFGRLTRVLLDVTTTGANGRLTRVSLATAPTVFVGSDKTDITPYSTVTLTATDTGLPTSTRQWTQTAGEPVTLSGATTDTATFTAPGTIDGDMLTFSYVCDNSAPDTLNVYVWAVTERAVVNGAEVPLRLIDV